MGVSATNGIRIGEAANLGPTNFDNVNLDPFDEIDLDPEVQTTGEECSGFEEPPVEPREYDQMDGEADAAEVSQQ